MKIIFKILLTCLILLNVKSAYSFDMEKVGLYGSYSSLFHSSNFNTLSDFETCCESFSSGRGIGFNLGLRSDFSIAPSLNLLLRAGYGESQGRFTRIESEVINLEGEQFAGAFQHRIDSKLSYFSLGTFLSYKFSNNIDFFGGFEFVNFVSANYDNSETLVKPSDRGTFLDGTRIRNVYNDDINELNTILATSEFGVRYYLPLSSTNKINMTPTLSYSFGLNSIISNSLWRANSLNLSLGLSFNLLDPERFASDFQENQIQTGPKLIEDITISAIGIKNGKEVPNPTINANYSTNLNSVFLANYVLFESDSENLPDYLNLITQKEVERYKPEIKFVEELGYEQLNLIGQRLKQHPDYEITLKAVINSISSKQQKIAIKDYLVNIWGIDPSRISTEQLIDRKEPNPNETQFLKNAIEIIPNDKSFYSRYEIMDYQYEIANDSLKFFTLIPENIAFDGFTISLDNNRRIFQKVTKNTKQINSTSIKLRNELNYDNSNISYSITLNKDNIPVFRGNNGVLKINYNFQNKTKEVFYLEPAIISDYQLNVRNSKILTEIKNKINSNTKINIIIPSTLDSENRARNIAVFLSIPHVNIITNPYEGEFDTMQDYYYKCIKIEIENSTKN